MISASLGQGLSLVLLLSVLATSIELDLLDKRGFVGKVRVARGAAHTDRSYYWPNGTIPYVMWPALELDLPSYRRRVESAIWEIELHSCVRFVEKRSEDEDYVVLYDSLGGCYSDIGRQGGAQITAVGRGCSSRGNVLHELLHTVGMWHTIARIDRDKHIRVNWDNMDLRYWRNFLREPEDYVTWFNETYDLNSIMHYSGHQFSKNGLPVIVPLDKTAIIGQRRGMSQGDKQLLRKMYSCQGRGNCALKGACVSGICQLYQGEHECVCKKAWYGPGCNKLCPQCKQLACPPEDQECLESCQTQSPNWWRRKCTLYQSMPDKRSIPCGVPGVSCRVWKTFDSNGTWSLSGGTGIALETQDSLKNKKSFSVALKSLDILESTLFTEQTKETCTLNISFLTSGQWWLSSLELLMVTGDKTSPVWSTSLRVKSRVVSLRLRSHDLHVGPAVNFSIRVRTHVYEARGDLVISTLEFEGC